MAKIYILNNCVRIEGDGIYPIGKLFATEKDGFFMFSAMTENDSKFKEYSIKFSNVEDVNGDPVGDLVAVRDYLATILGIPASGAAASDSKIDRIQGAADYGQNIVYHGTGTKNPITITQTGTTSLGVETIVETITYEDPAINGSNVTDTQYS